MSNTRKIAIAPDRRFDSYFEWQSNYLDQMTGWLIPDTEVWVGDELRLKINSLGCKGPELKKGMPVIGYFGDSTTMGLANDSWAQRVDVPGCQTLNAGIEGHNLDRVVNRYKQLRQQVDFAGVVVFSGWHNIIYNHRDEAYWRRMLDAFDGEHLTAFCTLATCLTDECRERGLDELLNNERTGTEQKPGTDGRAAAGKPYFNFWCDMEPSRENVVRVLDGVQRYNRFLRAYCAEKSRVLIDLHDALRPTDYDAIPRDFFDVCHFRADLYPRVGEIVRGAIAEPMKPALAAWQARSKSASRRPRSAPAVAGARDGKARTLGEKLRNRFYPIW
ncbi:MAG: hypothetical protein K8S99_18540 [Planctomycetes bacterium]|nr:hypothetical protein [Planctomycetota bacterium]